MGQQPVPSKRQRTRLYAGIVWVVRMPPPSAASLSVSVDTVVTLAGAILIAAAHARLLLCIVRKTQLAVGERWRCKLILEACAVLVSTGLHIVGMVVAALSLCVGSVQWCFCATALVVNVLLLYFVPILPPYHRDIFAVLCWAYSLLLVAWGTTIMTRCFETTKACDANLYVVFQVQLIVAMLQTIAISAGGFFW